MPPKKNAYRRNYAHVFVAKSSIHGRGLYASEHIGEDTLIGIYEGDKVQRDGAYVLWVEDGKGGIYGVRGRNELRFLNHSSRPNAEFDGEKLWALRDIEPQEEITFNYGDEWEDILDPVEEPVAALSV